MEDSVKSVRAIEPMLIAHDNDLFARIKQQANIFGTLSKIQRADLKICNISDHTLQPFCVFQMQNSFLTTFLWHLNLAFITFNNQNGNYKSLETVLIWKKCSIEIIKSFYIVEFCLFSPHLQMWLLNQSFHRFHYCFVARMSSKVPRNTQEASGHHQATERSSVVN